MSKLPALTLGLVAIVATSSALAQNAAPPTDCPPGSVGKAEGQNTWCEPSICESEAQCTPGQVCRSVALCVQIGTLDKKDGGATLAQDKNAGNKLMAVGRCGPDQKCPENTVCNEKKRCVDRAASDRMGPPATATASASAGAAGSGDAKKSSCGCDAVGSRAPGGALAACLGLASALFIVTRRRSRRV